MLSLNERISLLTDVFDELQYTSSRLDKEAIIAMIPSELKDDFNACLEVLDGRYVFGFKIQSLCIVQHDTEEFETVREMFDLLMMPSKEHDLSQSNVFKYLKKVAKYINFLEPIVNKTLRLGIGRSLLPTEFNAPMLAKKFGEKPIFGRLYVTEKLDGNRCIAHWDGTKWVFKSRSGKLMHVDFDMRGIDKSYVYDGEILSSSQSQLSEWRIQELLKATPNLKLFEGANQFNATSGMINRHDMNGKDLVYHVFDVQTNLKYEQRRAILSEQHPLGNVIIVPLICSLNFTAVLQAEAMDMSMEMLDKITSMGGEGLMFNANTLYEHKRTNNLLKLKKVKTMDMRVVSFEHGNGKYEMDVGKLNCVACDNGNTYSCSVGTGLSDNERYYWSLHPETIIGKVVEVAYFEASQNKNAAGTNMYSLRFPRLIKVRKDKDDTSTN